MKDKVYFVDKELNYKRCYNQGKYLDNLEYSLMGERI